jgi:hypothetical protein
VRALDRALVAAGALGFAALLVVSIPRTPDAARAPDGAPPEALAPREARAADTARDTGPRGFSADFAAHLKRVGQISPSEFAARFAPPQYHPELSFDPTTAKFFKEMTADVVKKPAREYTDERGEKRMTHEQQFPGIKLTPDELAKFKANGFVVTERLGARNFAQVYLEVYRRDLPVFVTADSVLHAWHRTYDAILEELERDFLSEELEAVLEEMHAAIPAAHKEYGAGALAESVKDADFFLAVARSLLADAHCGTRLDQGDRAARTVAAVRAEGAGKIDLFGRSRDVDFSLFRPRGHYENDPRLRAYFRALVWCGYIDLRVAGGYDETGVPSSARELGSAVVLLDLLRKAKKEEAWRRFDGCLQALVGRADCATFDDLARVAAKAKVKSPADLKNAADLRALADTVLKTDAGTQDVTGHTFFAPRDGRATVLPRSFALVGQRFAVDAWASTKTGFDDIVWNGTRVPRHMGSAEDVAFAALGNNHVVPQLVERIERGPHPRRDQKPYQHNLAAARAVIDGLEPLAWDDSIYMQWLKTLRTLSAPGDKAAPEVTRTREWAQKNTNTQLASWTQLRHDTIALVKPPHLSGATCYYPAGYVEPVVPFWAAMDAMASRSAALIEQLPFPKDVQPMQAKQVKFLRAFAVRMGQLRGIAEKQLAQKELTAAEIKLLEDVMEDDHRHVCGRPPQYKGWYPNLFYRGKRDFLKWDALVADVLNDPTAGQVLHQAVGNVDVLIVAIDNGKDRVLYLGPTLSHYEFETPLSGRKTDNAWKVDYLNGDVPPRPERTRGYLVPLPNREKLTGANRVTEYRDRDDDDE